MEMSEEVFLSTDVYVRKCYPELFKRLLENIKYVLVTKLADTLILFTGTPGMGKTTFIGYCFNQLRSTGLKFLVSIGSTTCKYDGSIIMSNTELNHLLSTSYQYEYIYLLDASSLRPPIPSNAVTVLFASPKLANCGKFPRARMITMLMPPWHKEELRDCLKQVYEVDNKQAFEEDYKLWGGSIGFHRLPPTRIFDEFLNSNELIMMVDQIAATGWFSCQTEDKTNYQSFLFRSPPVDDTSEHKQEISFPSPTLTARIVSSYCKRTTANIIGCDGTELGVKYEEFIFEKVLCFESKFLPMDVANKKGLVATIPKVENVALFSNSSYNIKASKHILHRPTEKNKTGYDALLGNFVIQITINPKHKSLNLGSVNRQCVEPTGGWKVLIITTHQNLAVPSIKELKIAKEDVYIATVNFQDSAILALLANDTFSE